MLSLDIHRRIGTLDLAVSIDIAGGEVVAVLGPNGAGKTSILRTIAGLDPLDSGSIRLGGTMLDQPSTATFVAPEDRSIGYVFQNYLLFAHLTALENAAFGLHARGTSKSEARRVASEWLQRLGIGECAGSRPRELSGGQQQRVALARSLAIEPEVLLLDEPVAAVDVGARDEIRHELQRHLAAFDGVLVLVTHDPLDAFALADRVVIVEHGSVSQQGSLADLAASPRSQYVASLVGVNLLAGTVDDSTFRSDDGLALAVSGDAITGRCYARIHPHAVALYTQAPSGTPRNVISGTVMQIDRLADRARVTISAPTTLTAEITSESLEVMAFKAGDPVWASIKATEIVVYPG